jgi:4-oxalocrotonate tautomerase
MPVVNVKIVKRRSVAQKRNLVKAVTDALVKTIDVQAESVWMLIEEYERENWATSGELRSVIIAHGSKS